MKSYKYRYSVKKDEKIISKLKTSDIVHIYILVLLAISAILFPTTIIETFLKNNISYIPVLIINFSFLFFGIYTFIYFASRQVYLTNSRIFGKWGIFKVKIIDIPLNQISSIEISDIKALKIELSNKTILFDFVANPEDFRLATVNQIKNLIDSIDNENTLMSFSNSLTASLERQKASNLIQCQCCGGMISKESIFCVHCGQPFKKQNKFLKKCILILIISLIIITSIYFSITNILSII